MTVTLERGRDNAALLTAVPLQYLPFYEDAVLFADLTLDYDLLVWPLPDCSHATFLTAHDHAGWLERFDDLHALLYVVNLRHPWTVTEKLHDASTVLVTAACDLCDFTKSVPPKRRAAAVDAVKAHLRAEHGWPS